MSDGKQHKLRKWIDTIIERNSKLIAENKALKGILDFQSSIDLIVEQGLDWKASHEWHKDQYLHLLTGLLQKAEVLKEKES